MPTDDPAESGTVVEDDLKPKGAIFSRTEDWGAHVVAGRLPIAGQNPASSGPAAKALLETLNRPR